MTKLEKLKNELHKCEAEMQNLELKKKRIQDEITLEEQRELKKMMKKKNLNFDDLMKLLDQQNETITQI